MAESEYGPGLSDYRTRAPRFLPELWMKEAKLERKRQNGRREKGEKEKARGDPPGGPGAGIPPASARGSGLVPGLRRSHMLWSN